MPMSPRLLRPRSAGGGFDPRSISDIMAWVDFSDASQITLNGTTISEAKDKSGLGRHYSVASAANQPTYTTAGLYGKNVATWTGVSKGLTSAFSLTLTAQTVLCVAVPKSWPASATRLVSQTTLANDTTGTVYVPLIQTFSASQFGGFTGSFRSTLSYTNSQAAVFQATHSGTEVKNYYNATAGTGSAHTLSQAIVRSGIGCNPLNGIPGESFVGDIAEVVMYSRLLTSAELTSVRTYLANKWGISL